MTHLSRLVFSFLVVSFSVAHANAGNLDCSTAPGGYLCRQMSTIDSLLSTTCSGSPCNALFVEQASAFRSFVEYYNQNVFAGPSVEWSMGRRAWFTANKICAYRWSGDADSFSAAIFQGNLALNLLRELQVGAGIESPRHCQLTIN